MTDIHIVFDGPPGHEPGRFVEVEDANGISIKFGEWKHRDDGYWALVFPTFPDLLAERDRLKAERVELIAVVEAAEKWLREECRPDAEWVAHGHNLSMSNEDRARGQKIMKAASDILAKCAKKTA